MSASCLTAIILLATLGAVGALRVSLLAWAAVLFGMAFYYMDGWSRRRQRSPDRPASVRAIRRAILHAAVFGAIWGVVPVITFPHAPVPVQLLIGCLTAGMMGAGGFVLGTVPLAGCAFVTVVLAGSAYALLAAGATAIHVGLLAMLFVYAVVVKINLSWNGLLFVEHFLAENRLQSEITAREHAQAEVAHAQRMTALGELAGGIAHDFNNILQGIAGSTVLIVRHPDDRARIAQLSARILETTERGGAITRRLLGFARQDALCAEPLSAAGLLNDIADLVGQAFDANVRLRVEAPAHLPGLMADKAQLEIVLVNLATNARDAMPDGGTLTLHAAQEVVTAARPHRLLCAGNYIAISCTDTGADMDVATLARATEPFFTTKPKGRGTGLGLPMAKGFAEQSGGGFAIDSAPGKGTTVTLWLPEMVEAAPPRPAPAPMPGEKPAAAPRYVLVVDDDLHVRETIVLSLVDAGFVVTEAEDGPRALQHLARGALLDALVTDLRMPGIDGLQLIQAARAHKPGLAAILLTGHMGDVGQAAPGGGRAESGTYTVVQKPVRPDQLAAQLMAALDSGGP